MTWICLFFQCQNIQIFSDACKSVCWLILTQYEESNLFFDVSPCKLITWKGTSRILFLTGIEMIPFVYYWSLIIMTCFPLFLIPFYRWIAYWICKCLCVCESECQRKLNIQSETNMAILTILYFWLKNSRIEISHCYGMNPVFGK